MEQAAAEMARPVSIPSDRVMDFYLPVWYRETQHGGKSQSPLIGSWISTREIAKSPTSTSVVSIPSDRVMDFYMRLTTSSLNRKKVSIPSDRVMDFYLLTEAKTTGEPE